MKNNFKPFINFTRSHCRNQEYYLFSFHYFLTKQPFVMMKKFAAGLMICAFVSAMGVSTTAKAEAANTQEQNKGTVFSAKVSIPFEMVAVADYQVHEMFSVTFKSFLVPQMLLKVAPPVSIVWPSCNSPG